MGNTLIKEKEYNILLMFLDFYVCLVKNLISRTQWEKHVMKGRVQWNNILINMFSLCWYDYTFSCSSMIRTHVKIKRSAPMVDKIYFKPFVWGMSPLISSYFEFWPLIALDPRCNPRLGSIFCWKNANSCIYFSCFSD